MDRYQIEKAQYQGFFVLGIGKPGDLSRVLCAGSLEECLAFVRAQFQPEANSGA